MSKSLYDTINLGYDKESSSEIKKIHKEEDSSSIKPIEIELTKVIKTNSRNENSVIDKLDTGFGCENTLVIEKPFPKFHTHLCKENYLGEFKSSSEKQMARNNLEVYSIDEIDKLLANILLDSTEIVGKLDFVNSTEKSYANYDIPNNLF
jgi:hypothetical protein